MDKHEALFLPKAILIKELRREGAEKMREASFLEAEVPQHGSW
jgi:hypothetical protein